MSIAIKGALFRRLLPASFCLLAGLFLLAAAQVESDLPVHYWQHPLSAQGEKPKHWSPMYSDLKPETCAQCHQEQYDAWQGSRHAKAYSPGLSGQFPSMGMASSQACLQCHAPLAEQAFKHPEDLQKKHELRQSGVSCAVCHVRAWQRYGPPRLGSMQTGHIETSVHGGFTALKGFEQSRFCASCHQFPESMAINGKPLENTLAEWRASGFASKGVHCQACHMPNRQHLFRGIHDKAMTLRGLLIHIDQSMPTPGLSISSTAIGHAFPTYVTPKVLVLEQAFDGKGSLLQSWQWAIVREVYYDQGWKERRDTRLMPGETRLYRAAKIPKTAVRLRFRIEVQPDAFYQGVYRSLLQHQTEQAGDQALRKALAMTESSPYTLYESEVSLAH